MSGLRSRSARLQSTKEPSLPNLRVNAPRARDRPSMTAKIDFPMLYDKGRISLSDGDRWDGSTKPKLGT